MNFKFARKKKKRMNFLEKWKSFLKNREYYKKITILAITLHFIFKKKLYTYKIDSRLVSFYI